MASCARRFSDTLFAFVDVETTGFDPRNDRVVEVACVLTRGARRIDSFSTLVDPELPIPATASAVHHLTDDCVQHAPRLETVAPRLRALTAGAIVVAHNAQFDLGFLPFLRERPTLCSMRFAQMALPDAPNYKNQVLRYHLGIRDAALTGTNAHRALGDALVTSLVFAECVRRYLTAGGLDDVPAAIQAAMQPRELQALTFGRHRGKPIGDVPADYLEWLSGAAAMPSRDVTHTVRLELKRRRASRPPAGVPVAACRGTVDERA